MIALSRETGDDIGTTDPGLPGRFVRAIHGRMTTRAALSRLVAGQHARIMRTGGRSWQIVADKTVRAVPSVEPAAPDTPDPIIVTATKRGTTLAAYPGTAVTLSLSPMQSAGVPADSQAIEDHLSSISSTHFGAGRDKIFVRGIADSGFTGPAQSTTGQYLNDTRLTYNAPDPNLRLYDIARVEILEGPQGALYGAGSLGGVLRVVTVRPQLGVTSARVSAGAAATEHGAASFDTAGVVNLPVSDATALRFVGYAMRDGGYIDDPQATRHNINTVDTIGARGALRTEPGDWTVDLDVAVQCIAGADSQWTDADAPPLQRASTTPLGYRSDYLLGDVTVSRRWGDIGFVSTTSASYQYVMERYDANGLAALPTVAHQTNRIALFTNETRIARQESDGTGWLVGTSILHNDTRLDRIAIDSAGGTTPHQVARNQIWEETLFGEAGVALRHGLLATAGARLTNADTRGDATAYVDATTIPIFTGVVSGSGGQDKFRVVPTVALSARPASGTLLFLRYQQGFRPGGFGISNSHAKEYGGDRIDMVEGGARWGTPAFDLAASISYSRWNAIIAEVVTQLGDPITQNIGDGRIVSFEARATWRAVHGLALNGSLFVNRSVLLHPRFTSIALESGALPNVARFGAQAGGDYTIDLQRGRTVSLSANGRYFGGSGVGAGPLLDATQGDYLDSQVMLAVAAGQRTLTLSATNLQGETGNRFALGTPYQIYRAQATPMRPRTIRLGIDFKL